MIDEKTTVQVDDEEIIKDDPEFEIEDVKSGSKSIESKIDEIKRSLEEDGYKGEFTYQFLNINEIGCYIKGKFIEEIEVPKISEHPMFHFYVEEGVGVGRDGKLFKVDKGDYLVFYSTQLGFLLKDKKDVSLAIIYNGKKQIITKKNKKIKINTYICLVKK